MCSQYALSSATPPLPRKRCLQKCSSNSQAAANNSCGNITGCLVCFCFRDHLGQAHLPRRFATPRAKVRARARMPVLGPLSGAFALIPDLATA
eukprot:3941019-Alexandrium_andersonii.AAC.1